MTADKVSLPSGRSVVGIDLDGVCADYIGGIRAYAAQHFGMAPAELTQPTSYNLVKAWPFRDLDDYLEVHRAAVADGLYRRLPVIDGAAEAMRRLSAAGAHIRIVTHRLILGGHHAQVVADTAAWLDQVGIPYMSLCFTGLKDSVGAHLYVEDSPAMVESLRTQGWPTLVFDHPYNQHVDGPRITSWKTGTTQILERIGIQDVPITAPTSTT